MNYLCLISEGRENHSYRFSAPDRPTAEEQARKYFEQFTYDTGREYYDEESLPDVLLFEVSPSIPVNIKDFWKEKQARDEKKRKQFQEEADRKHFEFLKKKFEKIHKTDCQCKSCVGM